MIRDPGLCGTILGLGRVAGNKWFWTNKCASLMGLQFHSFSVVGKLGYVYNTVGSRKNERYTV